MGTPKDKDSSLSGKPVFGDLGVFKVIELQKLATKEEIQEIRNELEELKKLILAAQVFDKKTNQPNCDDPNKFKLIRALADALGVDLSNLNLNE